MLRRRDAGTTVGGEKFFRTSGGPTITKLSPSGGAANGGYTVTIKGTGLATVQHVFFRSTEATSITVDPNGLEVSATVPALEAGRIQVYAETASGALAQSQKTFKAKPKITQVIPSSGSVTADTPVTVIGEGFAVGQDATAIDFNGAGRSANCTSHTECTTVAPKSKKTGDAKVSVQIRGGIKGKAKGVFTYTP